MSESEWLPPLITVVGAAFVGFAGTGCWLVVFRSWEYGHQERY